MRQRQETTRPLPIFTGPWAFSACSFRMESAKLPKRSTTATPKMMRRLGCIAISLVAPPVRGGTGASTDVARAVRACMPLSACTKVPHRRQHPLTHCMPDGRSRCVGSGGLAAHHAYRQANHFLAVWRWLRDPARGRLPVLLHDGGDHIRQLLMPPGPVDVRQSAVSPGMRDYRGRGT